VGAPVGVFLEGGSYRGERQGCGRARLQRTVFGDFFSFYDRRRGGGSSRRRSSSPSPAIPWSEGGAGVETGQAPAACAGRAAGEGSGGEQAGRILSARPNGRRVRGGPLDDPPNVRGGGARSDADEVLLLGLVDESAGTMRARCFATGRCADPARHRATGSDEGALACGRLGGRSP